MRPLVLLPVFILAVAACAPLLPEVAEPPEAEPASAADLPPPPPASARTVEEFDTTSAEDRAEAATPGQGGALLGSEVVSLGDPTRPGFWLETPLVTERLRGRVALPGAGAGVEVDLFPTTGGSRLSLAALRVLDLPLTGLPTVEVYAF